MRVFHSLVSRVPVGISIALIIGSYFLENTKLGFDVAGISMLTLILYASHFYRTDMAPMMKKISEIHDSTTIIGMEHEQLMAWWQKGNPGHERASVTFKRMMKYQGGK